VTDDRQTDHATKKCVAIGGITCTGVILFNSLSYMEFCDCPALVYYFATLHSFFKFFTLCVLCP